jgi:cystathionine beta-lyase/cystathionine gamma-synthase
MKPQSNEPDNATPRQSRAADPATTCARSPEEMTLVTSPLAPSIQLSAVYRIAGLDQVDALYEGRVPGFLYARDGHPNAAQLAAKLAALEGAEAALVCASGMAAEAALFLTSVGQGDAIAIAEGLYGRSAALAARELARFGVLHQTFDPTRPETLAAVITPATRLVFAETLSNPLVRLADIEGLAAVAHESGAQLVIDHTFAPLLCRPLGLGADAVTHSLTKLIGGHSDVTLGLLAGSKRLVDRVAVLASTFGLTGNPFESWLALRGLATLPVRSARACATALVLARRLAEHPRVAAVHYPGLPEHPDHMRAARLLAGGFGTIVTIDLGGRAEADRFIGALRQIPFAPSLGDTATTLSHPATTSHRGQSPEQWARQGITPGLVRLSIGLEDPEDLWDDLSVALDRSAQGGS